MSKATLYQLSQTAGIYDIHIPDEEIYSDVGSTIFQLGDVKRLFLGGSDLVISTATGGGGTLLVEGVDYTVGEEDFDYTTLIGFHVYTGITIDTVAYQSGDLYITYKTYGSYTDPASLSNGVTAYTAVIQHGFLPVSQTVLSGGKSTDTGYANYLIKGSSSGDVVINASTTNPVIIAFANGYDEYGEVNYITKVTTASTGWSGMGSTGYYYLYAQWDVASSSFSYGISTTEPDYGYVRSTSNPHYYEIPSRKIYEYASTVWTEKCRVFLGEFQNSTGGTSTSNIITYALNGEYLSAEAALTTGTLFTYAHNIGTNKLQPKVRHKVTTTSGGYIQNNYIEVQLGQGTAGYPPDATLMTNRLTAYVAISAQASKYVYDHAGGGALDMAGKINLSVIIKRSF